MNYRASKRLVGQPIPLVFDPKNNEFKPSSIGYAILKGDSFPAGEHNDTLLEYDTINKETRVYKFINGSWREL